MKTHAAIAAVALAFGLAACREAPITMQPQVSDFEGTGLALESVTDISLPLIGRLGDVVVDEAVITNFRVIEDAVGQIVGLEVDGVIQLTAGVLGTDVVTEDFATLVQVTSSGPGQCTIIGLDLGPIAIDLLVASVDLPVASVNVRGSGLVGSLLCQLLGLLTGGGSPAEVQAVVDQINAEIQ